jgi:diaminopimelate decarboxylase
VTGIAERQAEIWCDDVRLADVAAACGTPTYVYSSTAILERLGVLQAALQPQPHQVCYAVKTNSNLGILGTLSRAGCGFDIVSGGELHRLQRVGAPPERIVFAGVGKSADEMRAALRAGIGLFNVESWPEAEQLSRLAVSLGRTARVALRVNPDLEAGGHHYIATGTAAEKFGVPHDAALDAYLRLSALPGLEARGLHAHIGSQILDVEAHREVARLLAQLVRELRARGGRVDSVNIGGGLGIRYREEEPPRPEAFAAAVLPEVRDLGVHLLVEPGRFLVGNAGVLLTRVLYRKESGSKTFLIVDAGMNDLVRPSLYGAWHGILPLQTAAGRPTEVVDVVGPLCESGDFLARGRELPRLDAGELVAVTSAGAYGFSMSSNYHSRPRAAEVLVRGDRFRVVRARESLDDLVRGERDWPPVDAACGAESSGAGP